MEKAYNVQEANRKLVRQKSPAHEGQRGNEAGETGRGQSRVGRQDVTRTGLYCATTESSWGFLVQFNFHFTNLFGCGGSREAS